jgi:hypothetical protein
MFAVPHDVSSKSKYGEASNASAQIQTRFLIIWYKSFGFAVNLSIKL